jgi:hypothetical protein
LRGPSRKLHPPYRDPHAYEFNELDFEAYRRRTWNCPTSLVWDDLFGHWLAEWWGKSPSIASILPILAIEASSGVDALEHDSLRAGRPTPHVKPPAYTSIEQWTKWCHLPIRRIAALAGINKDSVRPALDALATIGVAQTHKASLEARGYKTYFRLRTDLFPYEKEPFFVVSGALIYGGTWAMLPSNAARHLYLVIALLDRRRVEAALAQSSTDNSPEDLERVLLEIRESTGTSMLDLMRCSGLSRNTISNLLKVLAAPIFEASPSAVPLVRRGRAYADTAERWYAPNSMITDRAFNWSPDLLNDPRHLGQAREKLWPERVTIVDCGDDAKAGRRNA